MWEGEGGKERGDFLGIRYHFNALRGCGSQSRVWAQGEFRASPDGGVQRWGTLSDELLRLNSWSGD